MKVGDRVSVRRITYVRVYDPIIDFSEYINIKGEHGIIIGITQTGALIVELNHNVNSLYVDTIFNGKVGYCVELYSHKLIKLKWKAPNRKRRLTITRPIVKDLFYGVATNKEVLYIINKSKEELPLNKSIIVFGKSKGNIFEIWNIGE